MRRGFLGRWICLLVSERFRLVWRCRLCDYSAYIPFCVHWHGGQSLWWLIPNYAVVFRLGWVYLPESDLTDKMKCSFFQAVVISILLYGCTTWMLTKRLKKLDSNCTRMLRAILNKSCGNTPQGTNYTATCFPSWKLSKLDESDMQDTAGEAGTNS